MISWWFPTIKENTGDLDKLHEEVDEFTEAATNYESSESKLDRLALISEGLDVIHAVETILKYHGVTYKELQSGVDYVRIKNELRGYYGKDERTNGEKNTVQIRNKGHV